MRGRREADRARPGKTDNGRGKRDGATVKLPPPVAAAPADTGVSEPPDDDTVGVSAPGTGGPSSLGTHVSRYVVLEEVGRGGMGRVLRAYDPRLQREVALKEVRREALGEEAARRLVIEARAMAKLSHPNVVAVYDVEAIDELGEVVVVMEYVAGSTLERWTKEGAWPWHEIVARYVDAGRGLAAAHAAGMLHRDFKPANVLVTDTVTKVTDFGLAKGVDRIEPPPASVPRPDEGEADELTVAGTIMGTPRYMPPEQHLGDTLSPAADQYAFCVALWEALHGAPPFSGPDVLSQKLGGPPAWTARAVPKPVVDALARGLAPEPDARWPSMDALLVALAFDAGRGRHRWAWGLAAVGIVAAGISTWALWSDTRRARCTGADPQIAAVWNETRRERVRSAMVGVGLPFAEGAADRTAAALDEYAQDWRAAYTEACVASTVRHEQSEAVMDLRMRCLQRARVELDATVGVLQTADAEVVERAHELIRKLRTLDTCSDLDALESGVDPPEPEDADAVEAARVRLAQARAERRGARYVAAARAIEAARRKLDGVDYEPVLAELALEDGKLAEKTGDLEVAVEAFDRAIELATRQGQTQLAAEAARLSMLLLVTRLGRVDEGLRLLPMARGMTHDPHDEAALASAYGVALYVKGDYAKAEVEQRRALALRQALPDQHPVDLATEHGHLADTLFAQHRAEEAEAEYRRALEISRRALGPDNPSVAGTLDNLGRALILQGRHDEAIAVAREAIAALERGVGPGHADVGTAYVELGARLAAQDRPDETATEIGKGVAILEAALGPDDLLVARAVADLAATQRVQGDLDAAERGRRRVLTITRDAYGDDDPRVADARQDLALVLVARGRIDEALRQHARAVKTLMDEHGADDVRIADARLTMARGLLQVRRADPAVEIAEQAWTVRGTDDTPAADRAAAAFVLARALWSSGRDRTRALALAEHAVDDYLRADAKPDAELVQAWLDQPS